MNIDECKKCVEDNIDNYLQALNYPEKINSSINYVLQDGKRLRSMIALAILEKFACKECSQLCIVPELIHSASLIIDDLPAFDNAQIRRGKDCVHLRYGEGVAYLLTFVLVTEAMRIINLHVPLLRDRFSADDAFQRCEKEISILTESIGAEQALAGQLLSTFYDGKNMREIFIDTKMDKKEITEIIEKKTGPFFAISIVTAWIFGGGDINKLDKVKGLSRLCGICYQIYDDFIDFQEDILQFSHNYVYHCGFHQAKADYINYRKDMDRLIDILDLKCPVFTWFGEYMDNKILPINNDSDYILPGSIGDTFDARQ